MVSCQGHVKRITVAAATATCEGHAKSILTAQPQLVQGHVKHILTAAATDCHTSWLHVLRKGSFLFNS